LNPFRAILLLLPLAMPTLASALLPPAQNGNLLEITNGNVHLEYNLTSGRANFYWQNSLKINGFYAGFTVSNYTKGTTYTNRSWTWASNQVVVTATASNLPTVVQTFIMDQQDSFLTRLDLVGHALRSGWMGPVVSDIPGGVDIGSYSDDRALIVPFDNDSFTFSYNAMPINNTSTSYEVSAFYDNTSRYGLVVGSVTHDTWKTGVYFQGASNKLNVLNVFGGETSSNTRDVMPHGLVTGNTISSPTVFVGFNTDWRTALEEYGAANAAVTPMMPWSGGVPFGWNSWSAYTNSVSFSNASAASGFIKTNLQTNSFLSHGTVYINLDSDWSNLNPSQLVQFANLCHSNGQRAGIYWTPFVYWGTAQQGTSNTMTGTVYKWSDAYLRTTNGGVQTIDGGIAIDPTHPGFAQIAAWYLGMFKSYGFDYLKLDFLTHGALEGVHYDTNVTTGIQAYNRGMQILTNLNAGRMFFSESIAPIFPYQYANSRRIFCDAAGSINDTECTMEAVNYGWWLSGRLYQFNDPDMMKFAGFSANENQSRVINGAIAGTLFLNSDDLVSSASQSLVQNCLTHPGIDEVARSGISFRPVEGNTGTNASGVFVRQDGTTWYVAVFNFTSSPTNVSLSLPRLGISGTFTAEDLWSGSLYPVSGTTWTVSLATSQARLFRLGSGTTSATGLANQALVIGGSATFTTDSSGTPPFQYAWTKNDAPLPGQSANTITLNPTSATDAGVYSVQVTGAFGTVTNSAVLTSPTPTNLTAQLSNGVAQLAWPTDHTGWRLQMESNLSHANWADVSGSRFTNVWPVQIGQSGVSEFFRLAYP
jgi:alpha-galactosidase